MKEGYITSITAHKLDCSEWWLLVILELENDTLWKEVYSKTSFVARVSLQRTPRFPKTPAVPGASLRAVPSRQVAQGQCTRSLGGDKAEVVVACR